MQPLKKINGRWRGTYADDLSDTFPRLQPVQFVLNLKQGWFGHFTGSVTETPPGTPGTGVIDGYFSFPRVEFKKQMPVGYILKPDGSHVTIRENVIAQGHPCERDIPGPVIMYEGEFNEMNRAQGTWIIYARHIPLADGLVLPTGRTTGIWNLELEVT